MSDTYSTYAEICSRFYDLTMDSESVADFVSSKCQASAGERVLFVIQTTKYFNGRISVGDASSRIIRDSTTERVRESPYVVKWRADYSGEFKGAPFRFSDSIDHRAFSRYEFSRYLSSTGFTVQGQGDNFDETSFYTVAVKI